MINLKIGGVDVLTIHLDSKRKPKPSGREKKNKIGEVSPDEWVDVETDDSSVVEDERPARSQANPFAKKHDPKKVPEFNTSFQSSNIDAVAYDPTKKQLWVRFKGQDVYTYFDVPIKVYRGFWSAPSKGHYFWEKIRKNPHIKYQKLTASLYWVSLRGHLKLNANKQANVARIAKAFKNRAKQHPEWHVQPEIKDVFNGKQVRLIPITVDIVGYSNKVRVNIIDELSGDVSFNATTAVDPQVVAVFIEKKVADWYKKHPVQVAQNASRMQLKAASTNVPTIQRLETASTQLRNYLDEAAPEAYWSDPIRINNGYRLDSDLLRIDLTADGDFVNVIITDLLTHDTYTYKYDFDNFISGTLTEALYILLQGD